MHTHGLKKPQIQNKNNDTLFVQASNRDSVIVVTRVNNHNVLDADRRRHTRERGHLWHTVL